MSVKCRSSRKRCHVVFGLLSDALLLLTQKIDMSLRDLFCHGGEKNANIRIGILIGSLSFVVIFFISVVIFLRCYMERRRSNYRKKFNAAAIREEKADEDVYKLLTYLAYLRKMRLIHYPTKRLEPNQTRNLLTDDNWVELRRQAYEEIMSLYGTEECHISPSHGAHLDQSVFSTMSVSSSISAKEREHLQWYQENGNFAPHCSLSLFKQHCILFQSPPVTVFQIILNWVIRKVHQNLHLLQ